MAIAYQFDVTRIEVKENGFLLNDLGDNLLTFTLVNPRPGVPATSSGKAFRTASNSAIDLATGIDPRTKSRYQGSDRLLFKEEPLLETPFVIQFSAIHKPSKFAVFMEGLLKGLFKAAWTVVIGSVSNVFGVAVLESAKVAHLDSIGLDEEVATVLGSNEVGLSRLNLPAPGTSTTFKVELMTSRKIRVLKRGYLDPVSGQPMQEFHELPEGSITAIVDVLVTA